MPQREPSSSPRPNAPAGDRAAPAAGVPLRAYLARWIWFVLGPLLVLAAFLAVIHVREVHRDQDRDAQILAEALTAAVDRVLRADLAGLQMLADSPLADDPLRRAEFHALAQSYLRAYGSHVILVDGTLQMLVNTRAAADAPLPRLPRPAGRAAGPQAMHTGQPAVGDVFEGPVARQPVVALAVPVRRAGQSVGAVLGTFDARFFQPLLQGHKVPAGWRLSLRDGTGRLIAAHPAVHGGRSQTTHAYAAPSDLSGWIAYVEVPPDVAMAPVREAALLFGAALVLAVAASLLGGRIAGRRLEQTISALAHDGPPPPGAAAVREAVVVRQRLIETGELRRAALQEAIEARNVLQETLARISDGFVALDRDWRLTFINARAARLLGREDPHALVGRPVWEIEDVVPGQPWHQACERALATGAPVVEEVFFEPWQAWFETRVFPSVNGVSMYFSEVTERHRAEAALRASEHSFRTLAEQIPAIIYRAPLDPDRPALYASPYIASLGYAPAQWTSAAGPNWRQVVHPDDVERALAALRELHDGGQEATLEYRLRDAAGRWRDFIDHGRIVEGEPGAGLVFQGVMMEITQLKRSEMALREAEAYQRSLFDALADGVLLLDERQRLLDANPAALALLGYPRPELLALQLQDLVPAADRARVLQALAQLLAATEADGAVPLAEWEHQRRDGSRFPVEVSARAAGSGRQVLVLRDVSERRAAQRALLAYQQELSDLAQRLLTQERETTRHVAQSLHDQLGQSLAVARLHLDAATVRMGSALPQALHNDFARIGTALDHAIGDVRLVLGELRPPMLEEQGLVAALDNEIRTRSGPGDGADVLLEVDDGQLAARWPADVEYAAFMIAREAIVNAQRHADATLVRVIVGGDRHELQLDVVDDGHGIPEALRSGRPGHLGLVGMRERASAIAAVFAVEQPAGGGTRVRLHWQGQPA